MTDPSLLRKNIAIVCRTLVITFVAWILVRATWPFEFMASHFAALTVGGALAGIFWLLFSLCIAVMLFAYSVRLPIRKRQFDFWCGFWINTAVIIGLAYWGALAVLQKNPQGLFGKFFWSVSAFMWWLVLGDQF
jgi:hypothetical protein